MTMSELALSDGLPGFRLLEMELYNWGTFGDRVWNFRFDGGNALVTGDIGSGKSTWVDALSTLLIPPQKLTYNKAAGAERRERTDRSYLLGEHRSTRDEAIALAKPVYLRDEGCYSLILAVFRDQRDSRLLSLAQLRWLKGGDVQRIYICSGRKLSVLNDFNDFNGDGAAFKKRLRQSPSTEVFDSYADYAAAFRGIMGMGEKALELFNQTVSMKTIGDLDDFIRGHMLEPTGAPERVLELLKNFDTLRSAHDAVESSRLQRDSLLPLRDEGREHNKLIEQRDALERMKAALPYYALDRLIPLLQQELVRLEAQLNEAGLLRDRCRQDLETRREDETRLRSAIDHSDIGRRIIELEAELGRCADERDKRSELFGRYRSPLEALNIALPNDLQGFEALRGKLAKDLSSLESKRQGLSDERDKYLYEKRAVEAQLDEVERELSSLRSRKNAIPARALLLRDRLAEALSLSVEELPFAGEFLRVQPKEREWEALAERVLRPLALMVLVPDGAYRQACAWLHDNALDGRLSFLRVGGDEPSIQRLGSRALARIIDIKPDAPAKALLESELNRIAPHERCASLEEFYRMPDAVLSSGLVKNAKLRHDKNDEAEVADPRRFILGWSNAEKISLLEKDRVDIAMKQAQAGAALVATERELAAASQRRERIQEAMRYNAWDELDVNAMIQRYQQLKSEKESLEQSSDQLAKLKAALAEAQTDRARLDRELEQHNTTIGGLENQKSSRSSELASHQANMAGASETEPSFDAIVEFLESIGLPVSPDLGNSQPWQAQARQRMESRISTLMRRDQELRASLQRRMHDFLTRFKERSAELASGIEYLDDYLSLLSHIEQDDLPSYERRFRELLKESTLRDIALFHTELDNDAQAIRQAIDAINEPLSAVEYNQGTYIALSAERREDQDVRDFRTDLRRCIENSTGEGELYSEDKFTRVKSLLSRLAGETAADRAWTDRVTDARSWFTFTASERYKEDGSEKEFYSSSSGKSGGQKEKLAYTILASALAYQYRLGLQTERGGFRLVVIDEAFGRGSEESTRYGLRLFSSLGLQLILVTPLQKISVIEGSVETIHFIANPTGEASEVRSLGVLEYRREKEIRRKKSTALATGAGDGGGLG